DTAGTRCVASNPFAVIAAPRPYAALFRSLVTDDVLPVTGSLTSGARTNDTDLAVTVSLSGTGALAGDTVQLRDGTSALGSAHVLTAAANASTVVTLRTRMLTNATTKNIKA